LASKKRADPHNSRKSSPLSFTHVALPDANASKAKSKKTTGRPDRRLEQLKSLHERSNVTGSLPEGGRLKLESTSQPTRNRKPVPDFTIEFADLNDTRPSTSVKYDTADIDDDDDDLPEPHDILNPSYRSPRKGAPSSETNYSNSEVDSLIRGVPLDEELDRNELLAIPVRHKTPMKHVETPSETLQSTRSPSLKRAPGIGNGPPPKKRARLEILEIQRKTSSPVARSHHVKVCFHPCLGSQTNRCCSRISIHQHELGRRSGSRYSLDSPMTRKTQHTRTAKLG